MKDMIKALRTRASPVYLGLALLACADPPANGRRARAASDGPPQSPKAVTADSAAEQELQADTTSSAWTAGILRRDHAVSGIATVSGIRVAGHNGFDRFVLEFAGEELPSYHVEYVDRPVRQCGSGEVVDLAGDGWLAIRMEPARAHDDEGRSTLELRRLRPALPVIAEARLICDFEAHVDWVLGVTSPNAYRVLELSGPARLIVDVRRH